MNTQSTARGTSSLDQAFDQAYLINAGTLTVLIAVTHLLMILPVIMLISMIILLFRGIIRMIRMIHR